MTPDKGLILLVEDDQNDVFFLQYAFETANITHRVHVANDGQQAIDYLAGAGQFSNRAQYPLPCLIFLDLKLPVKMGIDVLRWIHQQPHLRNLLVIVLTSSSNMEDIEEAYRLGARSYIVKPLSVDKRLEMVQLIRSYWLELNQFPNPPHPEPEKRG